MFLQGLDTEVALDAFAGVIQHHGLRQRHPQIPNRLPRAQKSSVES